MLAGVNPTDLEALLEFVYRGEVSVDHSQLPSLLQAAHCLNIQGLAPQTISKEDYANTQYQLPLMQQHSVSINSYKIYFGIQRMFLKGYPEWLSCAQNFYCLWSC